MFFQLWRSLAATLSRLVFKFVVALSYAAGFNAMLFLPLYEVRVQSPVPVPGHGGTNAPELTIESVTSPSRMTGCALAVFTAVLAEAVFTFCTFTFCAPADA
jgi:hypothetical protein